MRMYITPVEINKFDKNIPDTCTKCNDCKRTLCHCIWGCNKIMGFWKEVNHVNNIINSIEFPLVPKIYILNVYPSIFKLKKILHL